MLAGGRYDALAVLLGAKQSLPAVGWAAGVERLALLMDGLGVVGNQVPPSVGIIEVHKGSEMHDNIARLALQLKMSLCARGVRVHHLGKTATISRQMRAAAAAGVRLAVIVGEAELRSGCVSVKDMATSEQMQVTASAADVMRLLEGRLNPQ